MTMTSNSDQAVCTVCRKQKNELRPRASRLLAKSQWLLCGECIAGKKEPRFAIIMAGRMMKQQGNQEGLKIVEEYIRLGRYVGDEILAKELVVT